MDLSEAENRERCGDGHGFRGLASTIFHENDFYDEPVDLQLAHMKRNKVAKAGSKGSEEDGLRS